MAPTARASLLNMTASNTTTKPHNSVFCPPFPNVYFETLDSSVPYIVNAALNVALSIIATFANLLVLLAMRHITSIRLPSKLLLCSLVLTDLGVGLVVQPQFTVFLFMRAINTYRVRCFLAKSYVLTSSLFSAVSLMTMTAISLDRYAALFFHLKYQEIVTTRRVCAVLTFFWLFSLFFASSHIWNKVVWRVLFIPGIMHLLVISVAYVKIYWALRSHYGHQVQPQSHDQAQQQARNTLNMAKYRKTASAMMWIYVLFILCYLPYLCAVSIVLAIGHTALTQCIWEISYNAVVLLNSCLNPFFYCLRLPEIWTEVMKQLRQFCCRSLQQ